MLRGLGVFAALVIIGGMIGTWPEPIGSQMSRMPYTGTAATSEGGRLFWFLDSVTGELELARLEQHRTLALSTYADRYRIPGDLVRVIYEVALQEGIDPDLAFRLVKLESNFKLDAVSPVGALGLAQVMLPTARQYAPGITTDQLFEPRTNLRIGLRFLYDLLRDYQGDLRLALLAYNRGPARVNELLGRGQDPQNGYAAKLMDGYRPAGGFLP